MQASQLNRMKYSHGFLLLATGIPQLLVEGASLPYLSAGDSAGDVHLSPALSVCVLVAIVVLLVGCVTCCKNREISFKAFKNTFEDELNFTPPSEDTHSMRSRAEVYTLGVPNLTLPGPPHLQPPCSSEGSRTLQVARRCLSYIQEVGSGWFGKVLLSEIYDQPGVARVLVKELKANASAREQNDFLQEGDPYRVLQHPNILQCLGQCVDAIPLLLVFEYCELGDLRSYLTQQDRVLMDTKVLQKMACEIAAGVTHLHKNNFLHRDLALRNCFVTPDLTVKVGDYGTGPSEYKEDYIATEEQPAVPLRWVAPELICERHGAVVMAEQTKPGNVWALGVTVWELFESAAQPYSHLSDTEVLIHVIKEQRIRPPKPQLELPYADRWYEVLQFCWLPLEKRATAEEVHRLLTYLRMQGQREVEEDFEQRWNALKPKPSDRQPKASHPSFPILKQFAHGGLGRELDEVLTVTETSCGLSFQSVWETARHDHYGDRSFLAAGGGLNHHSMFFPVSRYDQPLFSESVDGMGTCSPTPDSPWIMPVDECRSKCFIPLEGQGECKIEVDENCAPPDSDEISELAQEKRPYLLLQDICLGESSTDVDFFHSSLDSRDSNLPESQTWSSSDSESPCCKEMFCKKSYKLEDLDSWSRGLLELPKPNLITGATEGGTSFAGGNQSTKESLSRPFLDLDLEAVCSESIIIDATHPVNTDKLKENLLFLKDTGLIGDLCITGRSNGGGFEKEACLSNMPETNLKMIVLDKVDKIERLSESAEDSVSPKHKCLNFVHPNFNDFLQPLVRSESLVPLSSLITEGSLNGQLQLQMYSSVEDSVPLHSSESGIDFTFDSTSESAEVTVSPTDNQQSPIFCSSATKEILYMVSKNPGLVEALGTSQGGDHTVGIKDPARHNPVFSLSQSSNGGFVGDRILETSSYITINNTDKMKNGIHIAESKLSSNDCNLDEPLLRVSKKDLPHKSSLLISATHLDQISQDGLHENNGPTSIVTIGHFSESPDSLDSIDMHVLVGPTQALDIPPVQKLQAPYKTADSGYETENLESPEWSSQLIVKDASADGSSQSVTTESVLSQATTEIAVSVVDSALGALQDLTVAIHDQCQSTVPAVKTISGGNLNYRDSAYFSDTESEPEKNFCESTLQLAHSIDATRTSTVHDRVVEERTQQEPITPTEGVPEPFTVHNSTVHNSKGEDVLKVIPRLKPGLVENASVSAPPKETASTEGCTEDCTALKKQKLEKSRAGEASKLKEPDVEGKYLGKRERMAAAGGMEDGVDADEEYENSDDSDDDLLTYRSSSDSEDDAVHSVPVVVTNGDEAPSLKSLLKATPTPAVQHSTPGGGNSEFRRKAVTFFDDVNVYLFDQDTPTKELGNHSSGCSSHGSEFGFPNPVPACSYLNRSTNSESSTDEEGGGYEWDDDFSSPDPTTTKAASRIAVSQVSPSPALSCFSPSFQSNAVEQSWTSPSTYSRFFISPSSVASFSFTHISDSDMEQGGSSEDGEKD